MPTTLTIEDALLTSLAAVPTNVRQFSFLRPAVPKGPVANCCGNGPQRPDLTGVKAAIASLPPERLDAFKALVGADKVRVLYRVGGKMADITV